MTKTQRLDSGLAHYSITAQAVLNLKKPAKRLGDLTLYTAAAGSALAFAPAADASIIYSGAQNITVNRATNGTSTALVDLNGDGQNEFGFSIFSSKTGGSQSDGAIVYGYDGTGPYGVARFFNQFQFPYSVSLLKLAASSRTIGPNYNTANTALNYGGALRFHAATTGGSFLYGLWNPGLSAATTGFAGVVIGSYNNTSVNQFGWLHFKLTTDALNRTDSLTLIDWAFESVPGASIHVGDKGTAPGPAPIPEPSTLSLLALGAAGAALRRKRIGSINRAGPIGIYGQGRHSA